MSGFRRAQLGDCCEIVSGATPDTGTADYWEGDICWATPKDLSNLDGHYISDTPRKLTQLGLDSCSASILPPHSVLFSSRAPIGHVAINTVPMATNQGFKSFVPGKEVDAKFLFHWLRANRSYLEGLGVGATFKEVSKAVVSKVEVPVPPLSEQRRIAAILDKADALRAQRREALAQLDRLAQSIFVEMFGDLFVNSKGFPVSRLGDVCDVRDGTHDSPSYVAEGYPLVTSKNLRDGKIDLSEVNYISQSDYIEINRRSKVDAGDILMPMIGTIGNPVLVTEEPNFAIKNMALIKFKDNSPAREFVFQFLKGDCFDRLVANKNKGGTQKFLALGEIRGLPLPMPSNGSQLDFSSRVRAVAARKKTYEAALTEAGRLFESIQQRAFQGAL